ncbi:hypothetical protein Plhal304r1_c037g0113131 [Plasmopara halstedii]
MGASSYLIQVHLVINAICTIVGSAAGWRDTNSRMERAQNLWLGQRVGEAQTTYSCQ